MVTLFFKGGEINTSLQIGDTLHYCSTLLDDSFNVNDGGIRTIGTVSKLKFSKDAVIVECNLIPGNQVPNISQFIMFSKDNKVNMSTPLGYYARVKFVNNSTEKSEIFATACEIYESSK